MNRRRKYDSTLPFDDAIPEKFHADRDNFYETFGPVFVRNSYFSKKQPAPVLGDADDNLKKVHQFYEFWDNFDSWREFVHEDECDPSKAENRYEKRNMEQHNKSLKAPLVKNEKLRMNRLANLAYNHDPRIKAMIAKQEEEKQAKKKGMQSAKEAKRIDISD